MPCVWLSSESRLRRVTRSIYTAASVTYIERVDDDPSGPLSRAALYVAVLGPHHHALAAAPAHAP
eukprot:55432-Eustigmatos_ZCMA.PRE.1